jgi:TPR repeat protein
MLTSPNQSRFARRPSPEGYVKWYRRSAEPGDAYAQHNLAVMLLKGQGAPPDADEAFRWCSAAAEQGLPEAQRKLRFLPQSAVRSLDCLLTGLS